MALFISHCRSSLTSKPFPCSLVSSLNTHTSPSSILTLPNPSTLLPSFPTFHLSTSPVYATGPPYPLISLTAPSFASRIHPLYLPSLYHSTALLLHFLYTLSECNLQRLLRRLGQHNIKQRALFILLTLYIFVEVYMEQPQQTIRRGNITFWT